MLKTKKKIVAIFVVALFFIGIGVFIVLFQNNTVEA